MAGAYFADSSGLVKRYVQETGTAWVRGITRQNPSTVIYLARITAPTLCISALDDPFLPPEAVTRARAEASPAVRFVVTQNGGHVGFVAANGLTPAYWAEELVVDFLASR